MFKDQLSTNYSIPVEEVTTCLNRFRGSIYKPRPEPDAKDRTLAKRMQARLRLKNEFLGTKG